MLAVALLGRLLDGRFACAPREGGRRRRAVVGSVLVMGVWLAQNVRTRLGHTPHTRTGAAHVTALTVRRGWPQVYALLVQYVLFGADCPSKVMAASGDSCVGVLIDITSSRWVAPVLLYILMGCTDATIQCYCLWLIGSHANEPSEMARYAGCVLL